MSRAPPLTALRAAAQAPPLAPPPPLTRSLPPRSCPCSEVDTLNTYGSLSGAATLSRALAPQLLAYNWSTWNGGLAPGADARAGWIVGLDAASGAARLALLYVYSANFTWKAQNESLPLLPVAGAALTLDKLPGAATAAAVCYDTTSGLPLSGGAAAAGCGASVSGGGATVTFPTFTRDAAAVVTFGG